MREFLLTQSINVKEISSENRELDKIGGLLVDPITHSQN